MHWRPGRSASLHRSLVPYSSIMPVINVYVVRHGETVENANGIIQGQLDTQLNELGRMQAERLGDVLSGVRLHYAFTSDLSRARDVRV